MKRRNFFVTCASAIAGGVFLAGRKSYSALPEDKPFSNVKLRMSAPLDWFPGKKPEDKLEAVSAWGLPAYEWLHPKGDFKSIRNKADSLGLELSCIVGVGAIAPRQMVDETDHDRLEKQFRERIEVAKQLNCKRLIGLTGNERTDVSREVQKENVITCLKRLAPIAEDNQVYIVVEALNPLVDHHGYFLCRTDDTMEILKEVNSPHVLMLFDIYHQQITEGNVIRNLTENISRIGHFHVADNPGRKEPGTGELNYHNIFKAIAGTDYKGFVALECGHSTDNYEDTLRATLKCLEGI
ncbi:MAG TPA: TIM barrel protein [Candidatus Hydrogenedens sp.]|nr:TIM barrel protein [Candidatus Hydrogenedens sp.]HOK08688.1 TIM barrel protein [Candidatus Hydrogenedens sp.]HOL18658.1 TIM barrel protein [Candidatus Hydrogenedens sp.]HPP57496.1 TIM barrel protein [Candidatus Hydrogenedens sp.]